MYINYTCTFQGFSVVLIGTRSLPVSTLLWVSVCVHMCLLGHMYALVLEGVCSSPVMTAPSIPLHIYPIVHNNSIHVCRQLLFLMYAVTRSERSERYNGHPRQLWLSRIAGKLTPKKFEDLHNKRCKIMSFLPAQYPTLLGCTWHEWR